MERKLIKNCAERKTWIRNPKWTKKSGRIIRGRNKKTSSKQHPKYLNIKKHPKLNDNSSYQINNQNYVFQITNWIKSIVKHLVINSEKGKDVYFFEKLDIVYIHACISNLYSADPKNKGAHISRITGPLVELLSHHCDFCFRCS